MPDTTTTTRDRKETVVLQEVPGLRKGETLTIESNDKTATIAIWHTVSQNGAPFYVGSIVLNADQLAEFINHALDMLLGKASNPVGLYELRPDGNTSPIGLVWLNQGPNIDRMATKLTEVRQPTPGQPVCALGHPGNPTHNMAACWFGHPVIMPTAGATPGAHWGPVDARKSLAQAYTAGTAQAYTTGTATIPPPPVYETRELGVTGYAISGPAQVAGESLEDATVPTDTTDPGTGAVVPMTPAELAAFPDHPADCACEPCVRAFLAEDESVNR